MDLACWRSRPRAALDNLAAVPNALFSLASWSAGGAPPLLHRRVAPSRHSPTDPEPNSNTGRFEVEDFAKQIRAQKWEVTRSHGRWPIARHTARPGARLPDATFP